MNAAAAALDSSGAIAAFEIQRGALLRERRLGALIGLLCFSALLAVSLWLSGLFSQSFDQAMAARIGVFLDRLTPTLSGDTLMGDRTQAGSLAAWYYDFPRWLAAAWETVQMAVLGTAVGAVIALALSFLAAHNVSPLGPFRHGVRRFFDALRTIPDLILAIIFSAAFGLGATAGVITIAIGTVGSLGKLFSEAIENADLRAAEAIGASGAGWTLRMRFGVAPQVAPNLISYALLRLEINLSVAAALGIVGAGGIGVELARAITYTEFDTYLAILLMIVVMIFVIDMASEALRHRIIGVKGRR